MEIVGSLESRETVNAVPWGSWLLGTICGSENLSMSAGESGAHTSPLFKCQ